jgi:hypothetical protein
LAQGKKNKERGEVDLFAQRKEEGKMVSGVAREIGEKRGKGKAVSGRERERERIEKKENKEKKEKKEKKGRERKKLDFWFGWIFCGRTRVIIRMSIRISISFNNLLILMVIHLSEFVETNRFVFFKLNR